MAGHRRSPLQSLSSASSHPANLRLQGITVPANALYRLAAVSLPVSLGLGLIYLYGVGRITAVAALGAILGLGALMVAVACLREAADQSREPHVTRIPAHRL